MALVTHDELVGRLDQRAEELVEDFGRPYRIDTGGLDARSEPAQRLRHTILLGGSYDWAEARTRVEELGIEVPELPMQVRQVGFYGLKWAERQSWGVGAEGRLGVVVNYARIPWMLDVGLCIGAADPLEKMLEGRVIDLPPRKTSSQEALGFAGLLLHSIEQDLRS